MEKRTKNAITWLFITFNVFSLYVFINFLLMFKATRFMINDNLVQYAIGIFLWAIINWEFYYLIVVLEEKGGIKNE